MGKGDKGEVHRVEHELNGHEDGDDVALDEERADADGEEDRGQDQVVGDGHHAAIFLCADWPCTWQARWR